ncbi:hypothetical protein YPPY60_0682 [Yersinia pestis PY-60]|nr:hypothetical protein YPPY60_0682 [Yersinia pestis PY-60]
MAHKRSMNWRPGKLRRYSARARKIAGITDSRADKNACQNVKRITCHR